MAFQNHYIMYHYIQIAITIIIETTSESLKTFSKSAYFRRSIKKKKNLSAKTSPQSHFHIHVNLPFVSTDMCLEGQSQQMFRNYSADTDELVGQSLELCLKAHFHIREQKMHLSWVKVERLQSN